MKFTREQLEKSAIWKDPKNRALVDEATWSAASSLGAMAASKPKPDLRSETQDPELGSGEESVGFRITFIVYRRRKLDWMENAPFALKPLTDAVAASLGFKSDADPRLDWRYEQITGPGQPGCIVKIEPSNSHCRVKKDAR